MKEEGKVAERQGSEELGVQSEEVRKGGKCGGKGGRKVGELGEMVSQRYLL